ncbi:alpha-D-ribose 1-methylphosphonate 5-triphosphate diphosphatase [Escherichia coli]|nr:alpha-D-ribose 1-methylphosphonate 5-triphosphate diphosphatase [Escherichia coli]
MINVQNVSKTFILHQQNGVRLPVLNRASLIVNAGECVVLHGHSGSGKSTLLRSLYANYLPDEGQIQIKHGDEWVDLVTAPARKVVEIRKTTIGWVSQFLRCELPHHTTLPLFEKLVQREPVTLVSLMDHSPGQRQFANREKYREYYQGKYSLTDAQMQQYEEEQLALAARWSQPNRESIAALCRARQIALASHDDATHAHVAESHQLGSVIAEFPTTFEAAEASRRHGMNVLMGAPNIVRGGSHSGNVAASELAQLGLLDILSSDYYPASLLDAAFRVADDESNRFTLPQAVKLVTKNPAQALNLQDRGVIGEGKRADLVLAHRKGNHIHIDHVWRQGKRVF